MTRKILFFEGRSSFKFDNLGLAPGTNLKVCTNVAKGFKLKVWNSSGPNPTFVEVKAEKLVGGGAFLLFASPHPSWIGLIIGECRTYGNNGKYGFTEKKCSINFTKANTKVCLSLHYDSDNSLLIEKKF